MSHTSKNCNGGEHRLHMGSMSSVAHCADCGIVLPLFTTTLASDDFASEATALGMLVTWSPTMTDNEVAHA